MTPATAQNRIPATKGAGQRPAAGSTSSRPPDAEPRSCARRRQNRSSPADHRRASRRAASSAIPFRDWPNRPDRRSWSPSPEAPQKPASPPPAAPRPRRSGFLPTARHRSQTAAGCGGDGFRSGFMTTSYPLPAPEKCRKNDAGNSPFNPHPSTPRGFPDIAPTCTRFLSTDQGDPASSSRSCCGAASRSAAKRARVRFQVAFGAAPDFSTLVI